MNQVLRCIVVSMALLASGRAGAELSPDPTGLWYDPAQSGWGLTVVQQGGVAFAVLFVYDPSNHPAWYFASDLSAPHLDPLPPGPIGIDGVLYRATGSWFGGPFDPHAMTITPVGSLSLQYADPAGHSLQVDYTIDGTTASKTLQPQTWGDDRALLVGNFYEGGISLTHKSATGCDDLAYGPTDPSRAFEFAVTADELGQVHFSWSTGVDTSCEASGRYSQHGQLGAVTGQLRCGTIGSGSNPVTAAALQLDGLAIGTHGFAGAVTLQRGACTYAGHIGGVRKLNPDFGGR